MTGFDLVTRLFGLLLGLAIAEVLTGFARTLRVKANLTSVSGKAIRVGWLVPLLGMLVIVDQTSFWLAFYELHGNVPLNFLVLLCVLLVIGAYYLLSTFVFPFEPALWPDYDAYYLRVHRVVIGGVLAVNLATIAFLTTLSVVAGVTFRVTTGDSNAISTAAAWAFLPVLIALFATRSRRASLVLLITANALLLSEALTHGR